MTGKVRVSSYAVSVDGFGAGPDQSLQNPLGAIMPEASRERLVQMMQARGIAIIEDEIGLARRATGQRQFDRVDEVVDMGG